MKSMFKAATIALILCATMMSGCIDDIQKDTVDTVIEQATEDVMFGITFDPDTRTNPYELQVAINDGGGAVIRTDGDIAFGNWEIYRETKNGDMYDITYGDTELRILLKTSGIAVGNWYENDFAKCGESFYGEWEANPFSSTTTDESNDLPIALYMDMASLYNSDGEDIIRFTIFSDGSMESCGGRMRVQDCELGTWEPHGSSDNEYDLLSGVFCDIHATLLDDGIAEFRFEGYFLEGTWEKGGDKMGVESPTPTPSPTPAPTISSDRLDAIPITVMITTRTTHVSDLRRVIIMEDGTMELCGHPECFDGTWELHSKTKTSRTYYIYTVDRWTEEIYCTDITIYNDGTAKYEFVGGDRVYYGTWEPGIDRTQGAGALIETVTEKATVTEDHNDRDSDGTPLTADIKGALPTDYIRYILESDGTVEQYSRGECIYGTWELVSQTGSSKTYDFDLEHECSLTTFNDGSAELDVTGVSFTFKGTWTSGIIT